MKRIFAIIIFFSLIGGVVVFCKTKDLDSVKTSGDYFSSDTGNTSLGFFIPITTA